jgi:hypothetical protein
MRVLSFLIIASQTAALWLIVCIAQKKKLTSEKSGHINIGDGLGLPHRRK